MALTEREGVSCAAVLLVRLDLPLPVLHPGKREGYNDRWVWPPPLPENSGCPVYKIEYQYRVSLQSPYVAGLHTLL